MIESGNYGFLSNDVETLAREIDLVKSYLETEDEMPPSLLDSLEVACHAVLVTLHLDDPKSDIVQEMRAVISGYAVNDVYEDDLVDRYIPALIAEIERLRGKLAATGTTA